jgi:hypothetical protein
MCTLLNYQDEFIELRMYVRKRFETHILDGAAKPYLAMCVFLVIAYFSAHLCGEIMTSDLYCE